MKITLIHGQNHQGSSCQIGRMIAEQLSSPGESIPKSIPVEVELITAENVK